MQAQVVDLLSGKGRFSTEQALVIAEAVDMAIEKAQLVTVPILDARFAVFDARMGRMDARMESGFAALNARIDSLEARIDAKFERWTVRLVVAMLVSQTALGPIGMSTLDAIRRTLSTLVH